VFRSLKHKQQFYFWSAPRVCMLNVCNHEIMCFQLIINMIDNYEDVQKYTFKFLPYVSGASLILMLYFNSIHSLR